MTLNISLSAACTYTVLVPDHARSLVPRHSGRQTLHTHASRSSNYKPDHKSNPNLFSKIVPSSSYKLVFHTRVGQGLATQEEVTGSTVGSGSVIAVGRVASGIVGPVAVGPTVVATGS